MTNIEFATYGKEGFQYGDNFAESGTLTADEKVAVGTVLVRSDGRKWIPATASNLTADAGVGVTISEVEAGTDVPFDVGISGRFNRKYLKVEGVGITDAQADILRGQGIIALNINSID